MNVLLSCVGENAPTWHQKMENLVLSVRLLGGALSNVRIIVNVVDEVDPDFERRMARWDAEVRVVPRVDTRLPVANKLHVLDLAKTETFDTVVMVDCDVIVVGDLGPELSADRVRGLPGGRSHVDAATWSRLYAALDIPEPARDWTLSVTGERSHPYMNSGVLFVPHAVCVPLRDSWYEHMQVLLGPKGIEVLGRPVHRDQIPLGLTITKLGLAVDPLPLNLNLSTTSAPRVPRALKSQQGPPFVLHYHRSIGADGFLQRSPRPGVNRWLEQFNRARADALGVPYHGLGSLSLRRRAAALLKSRSWFRFVPRRSRPAARRPQVERTGPSS